MKKLFFGYFIGVFLSFFFLGGMTSHASSVEGNEDQAKIKVFLPLMNGYAYLDEEGNPAGYTYDYLLKVAQRTGWEYEFITAEYTDENMQKAIEDMQNGDIDIISMMFMDEQYSDIISYSSMAYGQVNYSLMCLADTKEINNRTITSQLNTLTVALDESKPKNIAAFEDFTSNLSYSVKTVTAPTSEACLDLLESGQADLTLYNYTETPLPLRPVITYYVDYIYLATSKTNPALLETLNFVTEEIETTGTTYFRYNLSEKHFPPYQQPFLSLTAEESEYISTAPPLRVAILDNKAPISDYNPKTNEFEGIIVDYMKEYESRSGLTFIYLNVANQEDLAKLSQNGEVDLIPGFPDDYLLAADYNMHLTSSMLTVPIFLITSKNKKIQHEEGLTSISPNLYSPTETLKTIEYTDEIFKLLNKGVYRSAYVNAYIAQWLMAHESYPNLVMTSVPSANYNLCIGVSNSLDLRVVGILEQSIDQMPASQKEDIILQNTTLIPEFNFWQIIQNNFSKLIFPLLTVFFIIIVLLLLLFYKSIRLNRLIALDRSHYKEKSALDQMTSVYNSETFKNLVKEFLSNTSPCQGVLIVSDIDDFKRINDTYGHLYGDITLQNFATQLKEAFPSPSMVGRIGGDEFAVFIPHPIDEEALSQLCTQVLDNFTKFDLTRPATISLGAYVFDGNLDFNQLYDFADNVLYKAKKMGKNAFIIEHL